MEQGLSDLKKHLSLVHLRVSQKKSNAVALHAYGLLHRMHRQAHGPCWSLPNMQGTN